MQDLLQGFLGRDAGPVVQFIKYAAAGGIATAVHIAVFHLLAWRLFPALEARDPFVAFFKLTIRDVDDRVRSRNSMIANALAFLLSNFTAYVLNILWVFERGRHGLLVEIGLFYLVSGVSVVLGTGLMGFLIRRFGIRTTFAFGANLVTSLLINYALRKFVIFKG